MRADGAGWIERIDLANGTGERIVEAVDGSALASPNDLVFDATGGFWFTDYGRPHGPPGRHLLRRRGETTETGGASGPEPERHRFGVLAPTTGDSPLTVLLRQPLDTHLLVAGMPGNRQLDSLAVDAHGHVAVEDRMGHRV